MENIVLPQEFAAAIGSENIEFAVKAGRAEPLGKSFSHFLFGLAWTAFSSFAAFIMIGPLFLGQEVRFEANGVPTVASPDNLGPIIVPAIFISIFILIGLGMLAWSVYSMSRKGGYFVGTPSRLVHFRNGSIRSIDWEQFSGDITVKGNDQKGVITLQMRTGEMVNSKHGKSGYVPDVMYISDIANVFEVERICRARIKQNDPTPAMV